MSKKAWIGVAVLLVITIVFIITQLEHWRSEPGILRIGVILPLSGPGAAYGRNAQTGIELALDELKHTIGGNRVRVIYEDSKGNPNTAVSAFYKLVDSDNVGIIVGPYASSTLLAVAPLANRRHIVLLSPTASAPEITDAGEYVFRNVASDAFEARAIARFAFNELKYRRIAILYVNNDFGEGHRRSFTDVFEQLGGDIVASSGYLETTTTFRTQLLEIEKEDPQAVYLIGGKEMAQVLRQATELALNLHFLSFSMFEDPDIVEAAGSAAEGVYYSLQTFDPYSKQEPMHSFATKYKNKYGIVPDPFASLSYDAIRILDATATKLGVEPDKIKQGLYEIRDFPGVTGRTTFNEKGDVVKPISIKRYANGKFEWIYRYEN